MGTEQESFPADSEARLQQEFERLMREEELLFQQIHECIAGAADRAAGEQQALELYTSKVDEILRQLRAVEARLSRVQGLKHEAEQSSFEYTCRLSDKWQLADVEFVRKFLDDYRVREN